MTENKRFRVTLESNTVRFVDFEENKQLMSISFKKHNDAIDCQNALKFQCDLLNDLNDEVKSQSLVIKGYQERTEKLFNENEQLKEANKELKEGVEELNTICKYYEMRIKELSEQADAVRTELQLCEEENTELQKENEQLKSELSRYEEVNRLDIWKSSYNSEDALITELQDKCDKKQEHIVVLENKIRRMREAIHKLEWLASHRNADLKRENEQLKKELNAYKNFSDRKLAENKRIHKDWDKLWQLCTDKGFTEEELIKELER